MRKITKRDLLVFMLGFLTYFLIDIITDWKSAKNAFIDGWNDVNVESNE